jgi:hypothetical protein
MLEDEIFFLKKRVYKKNSSVSSKFGLNSQSCNPLNSWSRLSSGAQHLKN